MLRLGRCCGLWPQIPQPLGISRGSASSSGMNCSASRKPTENSCSSSAAVRTDSEFLANVGHVVEKLLPIHFAQHAGITELGATCLIEQYCRGPKQDRKSTRLNSSHVKSSYA